MARSLEKLSAQLGEEPEQLSYLRIKISYAAFSLVGSSGQIIDIPTYIYEMSAIGKLDRPDYGPPSRDDIDIYIPLERAQELLALLDRWPTARSRSRSH